MLRAAKTSVLLKACCWAAWIAPALTLWAPKAIAPLVGILALIAIGAVIKQKQYKRMVQNLQAVGAILVPLIGLGIYATISEVWTALPNQSWLQGLRLLGYITASIILVWGLRTKIASEEDINKLGKAVVVGLFIGIGVLIVERITGAMVYQLWSHFDAASETRYRIFNRGVGLMTMLLPIALYFLHRRQQYILAILLFLGMGMVAFTFESMASLAALLAMLGTLFLAAVLKIKWLRILILCGWVVFIIEMPFIMHVVPPITNDFRESPIPLSALHRVHIWSYASDLTLQKPFLGWGMDASQVFANKKDLLIYGTREVPMALDRLPNHPHNNALQLWLELGLVGVGFLSIAIMGLWLWLQTKQLAKRSEIMVLASVAATAVFFITAYGLWQTQWLAAVVWQATLVTALLPKQSDALTQLERGAAQ